MAFYILGELGVLAGEAILEITGSQTAATVTGGAVTGGIVDSLKNAGEALIEYVLGKETVNNVENQFSQAKDAFGQVVNSNSFGQGPWASGDNNDYGLKKASQQTYHHDNIPTTSTEAVGPRSECSCQGPSASGESKQPDFDIKVSSGTTLIDDDDIVDTSQSIQQISNSNLSQTVASKPTINAKQLGQDLGLLISYTNGMMSNDKHNGLKIDPYKTYKSAIDLYPNLNYLIPKIIDYTSLVITPNTEEYNKIKQVYNGRNIDYRNAYFGTDQSGNRTVNLKNELGTLETWIVKNDGVKLPTIHGNYVGPYSHNSGLPIDLLDSFAFFHDIGYQRNGFFSLEDDYKFIARIEQNMDRMGIGERMVAKFSIDYFSSIGHTFATYKASLPDKVVNEVITEPQKNDDILPMFMDTNDADYPQKRLEFYKSLSESVHSNSVSSTMGTYNPQFIGVQKTIAELDSMMIELY